MERYELFTESQIDEALAGAQACFDQWRRSDWNERSEVMSGVGRELRAAADELAHIVSREVGKPVTSSSLVPGSVEVAANRPLLGAGFGFEGRFGDPE